MTEMPEETRVKRSTACKKRGAGMITRRDSFVARRTSTSGTTVAEHRSTPVAKIHPSPSQHPRPPATERSGRDPLGQRKVRNRRSDRIRQRRTVRRLGRDHVKPVERPVELVEPGQRNEPCAPRRSRSRGVDEAAGRAPPGTRRREVMPIVAGWTPTAGKITQCRILIPGPS